MPTHLYCLIPAGSSARPPVPAIRELKTGGVIAWVSSAPSARLSRDAREAMKATIEHDRVVSAAVAQDVTPVPAALADPYESDAATIADIEAHRANLVSTLAAIDGKVEMTTIIAVHDAPPSAGEEGRGRAYLEQLRSRPARAGAIADAVAGILSGIAGEPRRRAEGGRVGLSHLVSRDQIDEYRRVAGRCEGEGYRVVIDGPRAPYSFASFRPGRGIGGPKGDTTA